MRALVFMVLGGVACSPTFHAKACERDADCGGSLVCVETESAPVCQPPANAPLKIGMSGPISGPSQSLGTEIKKGVSLAFDRQNAAGGIRGRLLELVFRDDQYNPAAAEAAARVLLDIETLSGVAPVCPTTPSPLVAGQEPLGTTALARGPAAVLALLGNVGTPTMVRTAPLAVESKTLFFGAFTGATLMLRDDASGSCAKYIFNVRASYAQEARATTEFFLKRGVSDEKHLISFDQNDSFGQAGYDGLVAAYTALKGPSAVPIKRLRYERDDAASVPAQVDAASLYLTGLLSDGQPHTVGVLMTDTYGPASSFITGLRDWQSAHPLGGNLRLLFSNLSFVGPDALAARLKGASAAIPAGMKPYTDGVFVSQVVPNYQTDSGELVSGYQRAIAAADPTLTQSFTSLEGYLDAKVFIAGLLADGGRLTPERLISAFENLPDLALGIGANAGFSTRDHQYSKSVWGTEIGAGGQFIDRFFWTAGTPLQLPE